MALILIVDDSPTEVHVMQKALEKHGYRTACRRRTAPRACASPARCIRT
jgi:CheY-like chemotaxis protein